MKFLRRILGVLVMIAGILGLAIGVAGLVGVWVVRPAVANSINTTIQTLDTSLQSSQKVMDVTGQALGATVESVDALSTMLSTTATSVEETKPVMDQLNVMLGKTVPSTLQSATDSLKTAQQAAVVLDSAIKSLETFQALMSAVPLVGGFVQKPAQPYNPQVPLADSLGQLATNLEGLPAQFTEMSANLSKADDNLVTVQSNLTTMSSSVGRISSSLSEYQAMIGQSQSSVKNLTSMLTNIQSNLTNILNWVAIALSVFFFWFIAAQVVILSQGWELFQGTADRMEGGPAEPPAAEPAAGA